MTPEKQADVVLTIVEGPAPQEITDAFRNGHALPFLLRDDATGAETAVQLTMRCLLHDGIDLTTWWIFGHEKDSHRVYKADFPKSDGPSRLIWTTQFPLT